MQIKYRLVSTYPEEHQIKVRFYSDALPESALVSAWMPDGVTPASYRTDYMITLPIPAPTGAALDAFVLAHCPVYWFDLKRQIADAGIDTSMTDAVARIGTTTTLNAPIPSEAIRLTLAEQKTLKNTQINNWRAQANQSTFTHSGKTIACDALSRSDIDAVAGAIALNGSFPAGFPNAWKATDNSYLSLPDIAAFKAMYDSMTLQGTINFSHSQALKTTLASATTIDQVNSIVWA
jgi:hypothetical protein